METFLNNFLLIGSSIILLSVLLSKSSDRFGLPILVVFMFIGMMAGSEGFGGIHFENYELTHSLSVIALCLIIFSGGVETNVSDIKENLWRGVSLSTLGIIITTALVGIFVNYLTDFGIIKSLLLGAILSATDVAAVFSAFKDKRSQVGSATKNLLKFESGSNDPMAYFLVSLLLGFINNGDHNSAAEVGISLFLNPCIGLLVGWGLSKVFTSLNNIINLSYVGLYPALTLSFLFLSYSISSHLQGNGFLAVYVLGLIVSSKKILHKSLLYSFYDGISWLSQIGLFVMLGLLVFPSRLINIAPMGLMVAVFLIFIARPVTIFICLAFSKFSLREKVFISWAGLKGATPIVFASLAAVRIRDNAHPIFDIVFFVVLVSALLQGLTLKFFARKLGLLIESVEDPNFPIDIEVFEKTRNGIKELRIEPSYFSVEKRVVDLSLPQGCLVLFIKRDGAFIVPDGATKFEALDGVLIVTKTKEDIIDAIKCFKDGVEAKEIIFENKKDDQIDLYCEKERS